MLKHFALTAAAAFALSGATVTFADSQNWSSQAQNPNQQQQGQMQHQKEEASKEFLSNAWQTNQLEIQLGQKVEQTATNPQIKQFAQQLVQGHQQLAQQIQQTAKQDNVSLPQKLDSLHEAQLEHYSGMQGQRLEREFLFQQVAAHQKALLECRYQASHSQDPHVKQLAQMMSQHLQQHWQQAQQLAQAQIGTGGEAQPAGYGMPPNQGGQQNQQGQQGGQVR